MTTEWEQGEGQEEAEWATMTIEIRGITKQNASETFGSRDFSGIAKSTKLWQIMTGYNDYRLGVTLEINYESFGLADVNAKKRGKMMKEWMMMAMMW